MEKKILIVGHGLDGSMIANALEKANLTANDVFIIEEGSEEAKRLLSQHREFPKVEERVFEVAALPRPKEYYFEDYKDFLNRKPKGGKKNKRNWNY